MNKPIFTIIAPVHNEEPVLDELHRRVAEVMSQTGEGPDSWELVLVDDGSTDRSAEIMAALNRKDPRVKGISLSRNFGFQVAVTCGLDHAQGDAVILIDADLQDPPEVILQMIEKWREGYDVAYGVRGEREGETWFKKTSASYFYRLIHSITSVKIPVDTGDFRLMDRKVVDAIRQLPEKHRFLRGMVSWVGFRQIGVVYRRHPRYAGNTKFTLRKMVKFATDAITSFSYVPLQLATWAGFAIAGLGLLAIVVVILGRLSGAAEFRGQATTLVSVLFLGGIQLVCLGILGEYLGRIYDEVKGRPLYLIQERWGYGDRGR
ncbi:MAG: glycosyltransferase family 2 protein [Anaerolineae bacterium]|nr:glycosyltransferase family 2 protein [Anaerolineae bacterium]